MLRRQVSTERVSFQAGQMRIPDAPGLGIDLNEEALATHPYQPRDLRHYTGNLTDIRPTGAEDYFQRAGQSADA